jgi:hypothetical protein
MMSDKAARFEAQDLSPLASTDRTGEEHYTGVERRRGERRAYHDRREEVRFEFDREDRRRGDGRRKDDKSPKFW